MPYPTDKSVGFPQDRKKKQAEYREWLNDYNEKNEISLNGKPKKVKKSEKENYNFSGCPSVPIDYILARRKF